MSKEKKPKSRPTAKSSGKMSHGSGVKIQGGSRWMTADQRRMPLMFRPILTIAQAGKMLMMAAKDRREADQARRLSDLELGMSPSNRG